MAQEGNLEIPITKLQWGLRGAQALFAFLAMCTIAAVISFDNKHTSSSILDNYYLFVTVVSIFVAAAIVGIPYIYLQYGKLKAAARALRQLRVEFVLSGMWAFLIFVGTLGVTIEIALRSCAAEDYTEQFLNFTANNRTGGDHSFERGITRTCTTGRAASGFGYLAIVAWLGSMLLLAKEWYDNRRSPLPKHDYPHEVTMHANSTKTSLESGFPPTSEYKDQVQMEGVQNPPSGGNQQFYSQPVYQQQYPSAPSPIPAPTSQPPPQQYNNPLQFSPGQPPPPPPPQQYNNPLQFSPGQPPQPGSGGVTFPEPKHYQ